MTGSAGSTFVAAVLLTVNIGCVVFVAARIASRSVEDRLGRALVATLLGVAQAVGVPLALAMVGIVGRVPTTLVHVISLIVVSRFMRAGESAPPSRVGTTATMAAALGAALAVLAVAPGLRALQSSHFETRHYHIGDVAGWLQTRTFWTLPFQNAGLFTATYPSNSEMFGLWLAQPSHSDQVVYFAMLPFALLAVLACASIARDLGGEASWGALCGTAFLAAPHVFRTHAHALGTDLPAAAALAAGVACLLRLRRDPRSTWVLLGGVALGLSIGSKYTVVIPCAAVAVWAAATIRPRPRALLLLPGLLLFAGPWFVRNLVETGNPVFPQEIRIGDSIIAAGGTDPRAYLATSLADHIVHGRTAVLRRWVRLSAQLWGPLILLAVAGVAGSLRTHPLRRPRLAVASLALLCAAAYVITPYSGAGPDGVAFLMGSNLRYAMPALLLGVALAAATVPPLLRGLLVAGVVAYGAVRIVQGTPQRPDLALRPWVAVLALASAGFVYLMLLRSLPRPRRAFVTAAVSLGLVGSWAIVWRGIHEAKPAPLDIAVHSVTTKGPVIVLGVSDLRSVVGAMLDTRLTTLMTGDSAAGQRPFEDPAQLSAAVERSPWSVLVLRNIAEVPAVPPGWTPPSSWRLVAVTPSGQLWVRNRASTATGSGVSGIQVKRSASTDVAPRY